MENTYNLRIVKNSINNNLATYASSINNLEFKQCTSITLNNIKEGIILYKDILYALKDPKLPKGAKKCRILTSNKLLLHY
jgi:hypothetical protein